MSFDAVSSPLRMKPAQSKRIKHPAFEDSDSEDDTAISKAMQFQLLLRQEAQRQESNASPSPSYKTASPENAPHSKLLHAIPSPFKHLHLPQHLHLPHFHHENKPRFLIVNESLSPPPKFAPPLPPPTGPLPPRPITPQVPGSPALLAPAASEARPPSPKSRPTSISPPRERTRRYTLDEVVPDYPDTTSRSKEVLLSRRHRSFDFEEPLINTNGQEALRQESEPAQQTDIPMPVSNHASSSWSNSTDSTRVILIQDPPQPVLTSDARDSLATPYSPTVVIPPADPPLGLFRFEKPKLELRTADLPPEPSGGWTPQKPQPPSTVKEQRERLKKPSPRDVPARDIKISAPASIDNATNFVDFQTGPPRTAPLPPPSGSSPSASLKNVTSPFTSSTVVSEERRASGDSPADLPRTDSSRVTNEPARKIPRFSTVAKVAGRLLGHQSLTQQPTSPVVKRTSLPPLLYSTSTPIEQHILAVSTRIKDEFKMKLKNELELPLVNAATEEEFIQQVQDMNEDIARCAKEVAKLLSRSGADKRQSKSTKAKKALDVQGEVRTNLNSFLVTRVFRPFSIQLNEEDDEVVRDRYEEIAPSVPQFIASRWRVVASASTSRPIQELGPVLATLAADASIAILRDESADEELTKEITALLLPLIRHAYLLAHFNHLEMVTADYDIFYGTEIGGWIILSQEEEKHSNRHSKAQDSRVSGYWSLGLRKKRYVGEGAFQRRVWDVLLKSQVLTSAVV